jgi:DNA-directed RNA polymerase specialized sigma24 family protein
MREECRYPLGEALQEKLSELHERVLASDVDAISQLCELILPVLRRHLGFIKLGQDHHAVETAAADALVKYTQRPHIYNPATGGLLNWLKVIAVNALKDLQRSSNRRRAKEALVGIDLSNLGKVVTAEAESDVRDAWIRVHEAILMAVTRTPLERQLVQARLRGASREDQIRIIASDVQWHGQGYAQLRQVWQALSRRARRVRGRDHENAEAGWRSSLKH